MKFPATCDAVLYRLTLILGYDGRTALREMRRITGPMEPTTEITEEQYVAIVAGCVIATMTGAS